MRRAAVATLRRRQGLPKPPASTRQLSSSQRCLSTSSTPPTAKDDLVQVTTLPNGVRVATEATPGHFIGAGIYVDGGSRYESSRIRGATHLTDRMAFKSTHNRSAEQMSLEIEQLGGSFASTSGRDVIMYQATSYPQSLPSVISVLADTVLNPLLLPEELEAEKMGAAWEVADMKKKPEYMLPELLHEVAFKDNTVGLPLVCPEERLPELTPEVLWEYRQLWFRPERMVVAGVGIQHEALLEQAHRHFGSFKGPSLPSTSASASSSIPNSYASSHSSQPSSSRNYATAASPPVDMHTGRSLQSFEELTSAKPHYTGGHLAIENGEDKYAHVYVGFETSGVHDPDLYALACIHVMMGGGSSFSAGGPGKGMYSRLYTGVLNQHYDVDYCQAFHHCYQDTGLFGMAISVAPEFIGKVPQVLAAQLDSVTRVVRGGIGESELRRAKNQLKSSLMFGLESRQLQVEDLGRQVQMSGFKTSPQEMSAKIDALTIPDLHRAASRVLRPQPGPGAHSGEPTIVAMGKLHGLGDVRAALARYGIGAPGTRRRV